MLGNQASYSKGDMNEEMLYSTIGDKLSEVANLHPDNDALVSVYQDVRFTYREFDKMTDSLAKGLLDIGINIGDKVGIWAVNCWEWVATQFATAKIGAILVNINPAYRTHELEYALKQSEASAIVLMDEFKTSKYKEMLLSVCPEIARCEPGNIETAKLPDLKKAIIIGKESPGTFEFGSIIERGRKIDGTRLKMLAKTLNPDDDINIQYTSGTTGFPKGVVLTHFNILNNAYHVGHVLKFTDKDSLCIPVPFYHCFGMVLANLMCATAGATMVVPGPVFEPESVFKAIHAEKCTALHGVPTMFIAELSHPDIAKYDLSNLRTGIMAGAPCPIETMKDVISIMNIKDITIGYGMTEMSPITTMTRTDDPVEKRVATVGKVMPCQELKIIDPGTEDVLPRGKQGEICFRGYNTMSRYYNNPEATADTIDKGRWLHSGDLGTMDEEGYIKITGRIKEMVIRGGENLYPREIEEFLLTNEKVMVAYVIGVPDIKYGEEMMAWVLTYEGETLTEEEIRAFCHGKITHYKVPKYWKFIENFEDIPMTVTGKAQKFKMRQIAIKELGLEDVGKSKT